MVFRSPSLFKSSKINLAPNLLNKMAVSLPIPTEAPVMRICFPVKFKGFIILFRLFNYFYNVYPPSINNDVPVIVFVASLNKKATVLAISMGSIAPSNCF